MIPLKDTIPSRSFPVINWLLISLNVLVFMFELTAEAQGQLEGVVEYFGVVPARFVHYRDAHEFVTLISSMFLHGGWLHLLGNMLFLYIFGDNVEDRMGPLRYLIFYLLCGVIAALTSIYVNAHSTLPNIGASGAIAGVLGAYIFLFPHARVITLIPILFIPLFVEIPAFVLLGFWFAAQLLNGTLQIVHTAYSSQAGDQGGVAFWAHVGGFLAGVVLVWLFAVPERKLRPQHADEYSPW